MKLEIILLLYLLFSIYSTEEYQLSFNIFLSGEVKFDLNLINRSKNNNNLFYSGSIIDIEKIVNINNKEIDDELVKGSYPLVYILKSSYIKYIKYFQTNTKFIIPKEYSSFITDSYKDYTIFITEDYNMEFTFYVQYLAKGKYFYAKIGKKLDKTTENNLYPLLFFNTFIGLTISIMMRNRIKALEIENQLPIYFLIISVSDLLFIVNLSNDLSFLFFKNKEYFFISEYMALIMYSFYKSIFYASLFFILYGWSIISFYGVGEKFKKANKKILLYDLIFTILILLSLYFFHFTSKLYLFYIKNITEHLSLLIYAVYCFIKKVIPLANQFIYEKRNRSDLVKCIRFKLIKLFLVCLIIIAYTTLFLNTPFLDKKYIYNYIDNFSIHFIIQLFFENIFLIFLAINFYPTILPDHYFDEVVFNYKKKVFLIANISQNEKDKDKDNIKLNISNLTYEKLKKISKKDNYPIVLINPFLYSKKHYLFNDVHIGIVQPYNK